MAVLEHDDVSTGYCVGLNFLSFYNRCRCRNERQRRQAHIQFELHKTKNNFTTTTTLRRRHGPQQRKCHEMIGSDSIGIFVNVARLRKSRLSQNLLRVLSLEAMSGGQPSLAPTCLTRRRRNWSGASSTWFGILVQSPGTANPLRQDGRAPFWSRLRRAVTRRDRRPKQRQLLNTGDLAPDREEQK